MRTYTALSHPIRVSVLHAALALLCLDVALAQETGSAQNGVIGPASQRWHPAMSVTGVRIERVDFVLEQASQPRADEAQKKKAKQRAAAQKAKLNAKAASEPASPVAGPPQQAASAPMTASAALHAAPPPALASAPATISPAAPPQSAQTARPASLPQQPQQPQPPQANASPSTQARSASGDNAQGAATGRPPTLTRDQLLALLPGSTMLRTNTSGALRQWVNKPDGTLTVYWGGGGFHGGAHSASGHWNVTDEGRLCLQIDWDDVPENWCRFIETTADGKYQPIADIADANWKPPTDKTNWRPFTLRH
jgi:hypothetical protein